MIQWIKLDPIDFHLNLQCAWCWSEQCNILLKLCSVEFSQVIMHMHNIANYKKHIFMIEADHSFISSIPVIRVAHTAVIGQSETCWMSGKFIAGPHRDKRDKRPFALTFKPHDFKNENNEFTKQHICLKRLKHDFIYRLFWLLLYVHKQMKI